MKKTALIAAIFALTTISASAAETEWTQGAYFKMGTYNNEPIIWRCVTAR